MLSHSAIFLHSLWVLICVFHLYFSPFPLCPRKAIYSQCALTYLLMLQVGKQNNPDEGRGNFLVFFFPKGNSNEEIMLSSSWRNRRKSTRGYSKGAFHSWENDRELWVPVKRKPSFHFHMGSSGSHSTQREKKQLCDPPRTTVKAELKLQDAQPYKCIHPFPTHQSFPLSRNHGSLDNQYENNGPKHRGPPLSKNSGSYHMIRVARKKGPK